MKEKLVNYDIAVALKRAGYPQKTNFGYRENETLITYAIKDKEFYYAPTYLAAWNWLWNNGIQLEFRAVTEELVVVKYKGDGIGSGKTPIEALEDALGFLVYYEIL